MSGFFGIFSPEGKVNKSAFDQMLQYSRNGAFDSLDTVVSDHISLGHMMLRVSPEAEYDRQPLQSNCGNYLLAGLFRLDYRDELGDKLGFGFQELKTMPDSLLVMLAFQKWKEKCVYHLEGDWAFVIYDKAQSKLFMAKDKTGVSALFHIKMGDQVFFSSDTPTILSVIKQDAEIDYEVFFRYAQLGTYPEGGRTLIKGLKYVNNAEYLVYDRQLKKKTYSYWSLDNIRPLRFYFEDDYVHGLFSVYSDAIRSRLSTDKDLGLFLSGGLDSTSVASLAALELQTKNRVLNTYTFYPHYESMLPVSNKIMYNEVPLVKELASKYGNLHTHFFDFPNASLKDQFDLGQTMDAYYPIVSKNNFWIYGIMEQAREKGVRRIFTGQLGNYTVTWTSSFVYAELFYQFRFFQLLKEIKRDFPASGKRLPDFINEYLLNQVKVRFYSFFSKRKHNLNEMDVYFNQNGLEKIENFKLREFRRTSIFKRISLGVNDTRKEILGKLIPFSGIKLSQISQKFDVQISDPTSDSRLIQYSLSMPSNMFYRPNKSKYIFKRMMKIILPESILNNRMIKLQSFDFPYRLKNDILFNKYFESDFVSRETSSYINLILLAEHYKEIRVNPEDSLLGTGSKVFLNLFSLHEFYKRNS